MFRNHGRFTPMIQPSDEEPPMTGYVKGRDASDYEERFYRAAVKNPQVRGIQFRRVFGAPFRSLFGAAELDFLIDLGYLIAVSVDGERFHTSAAAIQRDVQQDFILLRILRRWGVQYINHIQGGKHLSTQDLADRAFEQLVSGRKFTRMD